MIQKGTEVEWAWGNGKAQGKVVATYAKSITKTIAGNEVTRNGESGNKALLIRQSDGSEALKLEQEVSKIS